MSILPPLAGRGVVAITSITVGVFFVGFGYTVVRAGEGYGIGLIFVGSAPLLFAPIYFWRGGRLGAEIRDDCLVVHHYFRDTVFQLEKPLRVYRSADSIVIETPNRRFVLDDSYFSDHVVRNALFEVLLSHATSGTRLHATKVT